MHVVCGVLQAIVWVRVEGILLFICHSIVGNKVKVDVCIVREIVASHCFCDFVINRYVPCTFLDKRVQQLQVELPLLIFFLLYV